jgi:hypothetical protein
MYQDTDLAKYERSQFMPNAHFGPSKEGVYMPLRLTKTSQHWYTEADMEYAYPTGSVPVLPGSDSYPLDTFPVTPTEPYPSVLAPHISGNVIKGDLVYKPQNGIWGGISARNLSIQTRFTFYFRVGIEARVYPGSLLSSQQRMSPPYDPVALASYFRINRELKDAYSADYNDLGKLWEVIKGAAKVALPVIGSLGPVGMAVSSLGHGALGIGDAIKAALAKPGDSKGIDQPPAAEVERTRDLQASQRVTAARVTGAKRKAGKKAKKKRLL